MCLLVLAWQVHPRYRLVVAANRDDASGFRPDGLGWWARNFTRETVRQLEPGVTACVGCGLVRFEVRPDELRDLLARKGTDETIRKLPPRTPWPPEGTDPRVG